MPKLEKNKGNKQKLLRFKNIICKQKRERKKKKRK